MSKSNLFSFLSLTGLHGGSARGCAASAVFLSFLLCAGAVMANGNGENYGWQFQNSADKANQAVTQDMIQKHNNGYYAAPVYTTNIARQFNCNVSATSTGTAGANSTVANSPSTSGATSSSAGSTSTSASDVGGTGSGTGSNTSTSTQANSGTVGAGVSGSTNTSVDGSPSQAINSTQNNSGTQSASVGTSSACMFGAIN